MLTAARYALRMHTFEFFHDHGFAAVGRPDYQKVWHANTRRIIQESLQRAAASGTKKAG
jgi:hypothetical protein